MIRYRSATKLNTESGSVQVSALIYAMGRQAEQIFNTFTFPAPIGGNDPRDNFDTVLENFDAHFVPKRNLIHERAKFHARAQNSGETIEEYVRALYELSEHAAFKDRDETIRDRLVLGVLDNELSQRLQLEATLTLKSAIDTARHFELVKGQVSSQRQPGAAATVDAVRYSQKQRGSRSSAPSRGRGSRRAGGHSYTSQHRGGHTSLSNSFKCGNCGRSHAQNNCPARGKTCRKCGKRNHFAAVCRSSNSNVSEITELETPFFLGAIDFGEVGEPPWRITLNLGDSKIPFKIDTGADVTIMSKAVHSQLSPRPKLKPTYAVLRSPGGTVKVEGEFVATTQYKDHNCAFRVFVINSDTDCLLSRDTAVRLGLISQNRDRIDNLVFGDVGKPIFGEPVKIVLKEGAQPYSVNVARRIPIPLMDEVKTELDRMEAAGVIEKINTPTDWCAPMVPVRKRSGGVRICTDLKKLNLSVKRERLMLPTIDDILYKLSGSNRFSKLDATSSFWQLALDDDSAKLTTFISPFGRYFYRRLCFGITSAPEIFQRTMQDILAGIDGVECFMDDILLHTDGQKKHDELKKKVFQRLEKRGVKLNKSKCKFDKDEIDFLGHIISGKGVRPDPSKVSAITEMPEPENTTDLRRVLGMVNYLGRFVPNLSTLMKPLNDLLNHDVEWAWTPAQSSAFTEVKKMLSSAPTLTFFDMRKPITVSADASSYGLGGVLLQEDKGDLRPVAYCSRTLSRAEKNYAQIEKELLAATWVCEKFDRYLVGLPSFTLLTDHKPIVPLINSKELNDAPVRCQRMLMRMMRYSGKAEYTPGKNMTVADSLSRSPVVSTEPEEFGEEIEAHVATIQMSWNATDSKLEEIRDQSQQDPEISTAIQYTRNGWPKFFNNVKAEARNLYAFSGELSEVHGLLVRGNRIVIPKAMREEMLSRIHDGHLGVSKCRERAKSSIWWPSLSSEIREVVSRCDHCQRKRPAQPSEPLNPTALPERPFQMVGADLCDYKGHNYLVLVDYFSRYLEVAHMPNTTSETVVCKLKNIFARFGIPELLVTDNGPQFVSDRFHKFAKVWGFKHTTSSPHFPQSNGESERAVQEAKKALSQDDPFLALLIYRSTPVSPTGASPAELALGRRLRTTLPTLPSNLNQQIYDKAKIAARDTESKLKYKQAFDRRHGVQNLPELNPGQLVLQKLENDKEWQGPAIIKEQCAPKSYIIQSGNRAYRRNRKHLKPYVVPLSMPVSPTAISEPNPISIPSPSLPTTQPVVLEPDVTPPSPQPTVAPASPALLTTRSGRVVRRPARYQD